MFTRHHATSHSVPVDIDPASTTLQSKKEGRRRERERDTGIERERETDREMEGERDRDREGERETGRERQGERDREREIQGDREEERERGREEARGVQGDKEEEREREREREITEEKARSRMQIGSLWPLLSCQLYITYTETDLTCLSAVGVCTCLSLSGQH